MDAKLPVSREAKATVVPRPKGLVIALGLIWFCEDMESSAQAKWKDVTDSARTQSYPYLQYVPA